MASGTCWVWAAERAVDSARARLAHPEEIEIPVVRAVRYGKYITVYLAADSRPAQTYTVS